MRSTRLAGGRCASSSLICRRSHGTRTLHSDRRPELCPGYVLSVLRWRRQPQCRSEEARSVARGAEKSGQSPVSHRSVVSGPIATTFVTFEPGQPPVSVASDVAARVILDRPDEMHEHVTPPAPLRGRRVMVRSAWRPGRRHLRQADNDKHSRWRNEMKRFVTKSRSSARHRARFSRVRVGNTERYPWKKAWTPELHMVCPRSRSGPSLSNDHKSCAKRGVDSGPSTSLFISRSSYSGSSPAPAFPIAPPLPDSRLGRSC